MLNRLLPVLMVVVAVALLVGAPGLAQVKEGTHEGIVVKAGGEKLVMTDKEGKKQHVHSVSKAAKITLDDKACKLDELRKGYAVTVTVEKEQNKLVATKIEAKK